MATIKKSDTAKRGKIADRRECSILSCDSFKSGNEKMRMQITLNPSVA